MINPDALLAVEVFGTLNLIGSRSYAATSRLELELTPVASLAWTHERKLSPAWSNIRSAIRRFVRSSLLSTTITDVHLVAHGGARELETITAEVTADADL